MCRTHSKTKTKTKSKKSRGELHTPSMICKIVGQAFRPSKIDSRFRGNDIKERGNDIKERGNDRKVRKQFWVSKTDFFTRYSMFRKLIFLRDIQYLIQAGFLTSELCILIFILLTRYDSRDTRYEFHYTLNAILYTRY